MTENSFIVMSPDTNHTSNVVFGGKVLAEMDKIAFIETIKFLNDRNSDCDEAVTYKVDGVEFLCPPYIGDIIELRASVLNYGYKSVIVEVTGDVWRPKKKIREKFCKGTFVFITKKGNEIHSL